ncbi:crotonase/enoyl-CoA hydratase family protein [Desulfatibacillum aliphaticivorans]|uniref:crotonase/enoyl-CoA hydratase family protein n=1 Tax=Desulfatibacillum aliphaticivorans TaxID=218208 RepID=UPI0003FF365C|nr:crotonase/enoyl-CoA hydratase family protein [Desulfatibacillum aliphaticivorans]
MQVLVEKNGPVFTVIINRPDKKNAVDGPTAQLLADAFREFDADDSASVAVLCGADGTFCSGADLSAVADPEGGRLHQLNEDMSQDGPMGPSRMLLSKPVIAAVSGYAVAGGLELALWCDLRVMESDAVFGVYCRRYGVPLIDGGTQRLARLIGQSRAMDMVLTGRSIGAEEAFAMGLANRVVGPGSSRQAAEELAARIAKFPQTCMRSDRMALLKGFNMDFDKAMEMEFQMGLDVIRSGETVSGAQRFVAGQDREKP